MNRNVILKSAKRSRRGLSIRDFNYWHLEDIVHEGLLNKSFPRKGRGFGWPCYKISRRGLKYLEKNRKLQNLTARG